MSTRRGKLIQIDCEGRREVHAASANGDYATLCGLDGNDPAIGQTGTSFVSNAQINCPQCRAIWETARLYRPRDFSRRR